MKVAEAHWRRLVKNIGWANQNIGGQKVLKSDKRMGVSQLLGHVPGLPPQSLRLCGGDNGGQAAVWDLCKEGHLQHQLQVLLENVSIAYRYLPANSRGVEARVRDPEDRFLRSVVHNRSHALRPHFPPTVTAFNRYLTVFNCP